ARDLQEELPLARVPVERKKAVAARNVSNAVGDGWSLVRRLLRRLFRCRRRRRTGLLGRRSGRRGREQERREGEDSHFASRIGGQLTETLLSWDAYLEKRCPGACSPSTSRDPDSCGCAGATCRPGSSSSRSRDGCGSRGSASPATCRPITRSTAALRRRSISTRRSTTATGARSWSVTICHRASSARTSPPRA